MQHHQDSQVKTLLGKKFCQKSLIGCKLHVNLDGAAPANNDCRLFSKHWKLTSTVLIYMCYHILGARGFQAKKTLKKLQANSAKGTKNLKIHNLRKP